MNFFHAAQYFGIVWWSEKKNMRKMFRLLERQVGLPLTALLFVAIATAMVLRWVASWTYQGVVGACALVLVDAFLVRRLTSGLFARSKSRRKPGHRRIYVSCGSSSGTSSTTSSATKSYPTVARSRSGQVPNTYYRG